MLNLFNFLYLLSRTAPLCNYLWLPYLPVPQLGCSFQLVQKTRRNIFKRQGAIQMSFNYVKRESLWYPCFNLHSLRLLSHITETCHFIIWRKILTLYDHNLLWTCLEVCRETSLWPEKSKHLSLFPPDTVAGLITVIRLSWKPFQLQNHQHMKHNNIHISIFNTNLSISFTSLEEEQFQLK